MPAYISAASNHFGYITGAAGLPRELAEIGGGAHNLFSKLFINKGVDIDGRDFLSKANEANIAQGYAAGHAAGKPPTPFNDYGYGAAPQPAAGQLGEGSGISPFSAGLAGINLDEPAPPTWPPAADRPVRYLSRVVR